MQVIFQTKKNFDKIYLTNCMPARAHVATIHLLYMCSKLLAFSTCHCIVHLSSYANYFPRMQKATIQ